MIKKVLSLVSAMGINFDYNEPGHGVGHFIRDYIHALILATKLPSDPKQIYIGLVGGAFHDLLGCSVVPRYDDAGKAVRHAEASGLFLYLIGSDAGLSETEKVLMFYVIAGHTHYLKSTMIKCKDGQEREITPYRDLDGTGKPIVSVWFPRWVDRLDLNGPAFVGRHYLTLAEEHVDARAERNVNYLIRFEDHMVPSLRSKEEIAQSGGNLTMREHLRMYAMSQTNESPFGKHDFGEMVSLRDEYREVLLKIINAVDAEQYETSCTMLTMEGGYYFPIEHWTRFLCTCIEPSEKGVLTAVRLGKMFKKLPKRTRMAWLNGFRVTIEEYESWSRKTLASLADFSEEYLILPIIGDVRKIIERK